MTVEPDILTLGLYVTGVLLAQFIAIWKKLSRIELRGEHFVDFDKCAEKRKECPCVQDCSGMREAVDLMKERLTLLEARS